MNFMIDKTYDEDICIYIACEVFKSKLFVEESFEWNIGVRVQMIVKESFED